MSSVPVVTDVGETVLFVVTLMCEGALSAFEWDFVEQLSLSCFPRNANLCVGNQENMNAKNASKGSPLPPMKDDGAHFRQRKNEALGALRKERPLQGWSKT